MDDLSLLQTGSWLKFLQPFKIKWQKSGYIMYKFGEFQAMQFSRYASENPKNVTQEK